MNAGNGKAGDGHLLQVRGLVKHFPVREGLFGTSRSVVRAVDGVDLDLREGETLALVGETGSGKTTTGRCILRLIEPTRGQVRFLGADFLALDSRKLREMRRNIQIIFQDPYSSLNPRMSVRKTLLEPFAIHKMGDPAFRAGKVEELLEMVGLDGSFLAKYPHQLSGGQRQRVGIARALALSPKLVICDEPVSALDVSVQAQVINLLMELQEKLGLSYLFVAHDLRLVRHLADRIAVMYLGRIVETAPTERIFTDPRHPYTQALLASIPILDPSQRKPRQTLAGDPPSPINPPSGCHFHPRCPVAVEDCSNRDPALLEVNGSDGGPGMHRAACILVHPGR